MRPAPVGQLRFCMAIRRFVKSLRILLVLTKAADGISCAFLRAAAKTLFDLSVV